MANDAGPSSRRCRPTLTPRRGRPPTGQGCAGERPCPLLLPALLPVRCSASYPLVQGILLGFTDSRAGRNQYPFTGTENYADLLDDYLFWESFRIGLVWAFRSRCCSSCRAWASRCCSTRTCGCGGWPGPWRLSRGRCRRSSSRSCGRPCYNPNAGPSTSALASTGLSATSTASASSRTALPAVIVVGVWAGMPQTTIALLAGLQVGRQRRCTRRRRSTAPGPGGGSCTSPAASRPVIAAITSLDFIWNFNSFGLVYVLTNGGPGGSTRLPMLFAYNEAFRYGTRATRRRWAT